LLRWWFDEEHAAFGEVCIWKFGVVDVDGIREFVVVYRIRKVFIVIRFSVKKIFNQWKLEG
jgi:hypothetical protein